MLYLILGFLITSVLAFHMPRVFSKIDKDFTFTSIGLLPLYINLPALVILCTDKSNTWPAIFIMLSTAIEYSAALMDHKYTSVFDIIHIFAFISVIPVFIIYGKFPYEALFIVLLSILLGFGYGISDIFAFSLMGILVEAWMLILNLNISIYSVVFNSTVIMALTCLVFTIVQIFKRNITLKGKTKKKTAFIPYIFAITCLIPALAKVSLLLE